MSFAALRQNITENFQNITANVYWFPPEVVLPPAIVLVPNDPYIEISPIKRGAYRVSYRVTCVVGLVDNQAALAGLEDLVTSALNSLPAGYVVGEVSAPNVVNLGQADLLSSEFTISVMEG